MKNNYLKYLAPIIDFLSLRDTPEKSDVIFIFGSTKEYVAKHAANLFLKKFAKYILISGHMSTRSKRLFQKTEAEFLKEKIINFDVPSDSIIVEEKASNTLENIIFGMKELNSRKIKINSAILTAKPFHLRRCRATFKKQFPGIKIFCSSPEMDFNEYFSHETDKTEQETIIRFVEEIDRLKTYSKKGDIIHENIPPEIESAAEKLKIMFKNNKPLA